MARYKHIDTSPRFLAVDLRRQLLPGTYLQWIRRFFFFHGKKHPREMGGPQVEAFLSHLATVGRESMYCIAQVWPGIG